MSTTRGRRERRGWRGPTRPRPSTPPAYRGTLLIRKCPPPGGHRKTLGIILLWGPSGWRSRMSEVNLYRFRSIMKVHPPPNLTGWCQNLPVKFGGGGTFMMRRNQVGQSYYYSHLSYPLLLFLPSCPILLFLPVLPYPISLFLPILSFIRDQDVRVQVHNLSSEHGKCKTVKARFWSWLSGKSLFNILRCSLFVRKRLVAESGGGWVR